MARASGALLGVTEATRKGEANHFEKNISSELCFIVYGLSGTLILGRSTANPVHSHHLVITNQVL
jgi:hypothetical protein